MKVIAGTLKGKNIEINKIVKFRPTLTRIREDLFNLLKHNKNLNIDIKNSTFADLNCGSGSIGIEALSRGFKHCCFNDINHHQIKLIKKFLKSQELSYELYNENIIEITNKIPWKLLDVIYLDPPYEMNLEKIILQNIRNINNRAIIITESDKNHFPKIKKILVKKYKNKFLEFYQALEIKKILND